MQRKQADPDWLNATIALADLAEFLGVSQSAVMKWGREAGMPKGGIKGRYPLRDCVMWRINRAEAAAAGESKDIMEERRKLIVSQRQRQDLENAKFRQELFDAEAVKSVFRRALATVATQLDGLAPRITPRLLTVNDPAQMQRILFDECRNIRNAAADALKDQLIVDARDADSDGPAEEERGGVGRRKPRTAARKSRAGAVED